MGKSFFLEVAALGALGLAPQVAHAENAGSDAVGKANRSIVDARNNRSARSETPTTRSTTTSSTLRTARSASSTALPTR
jgi:hypothetical protein